jgi:hypothetical protein
MGEILSIQRGVPTAHWPMLQSNLISISAEETDYEYLMAF